MLRKHRLVFVLTVAVVLLLTVWFIAGRGPGAPLQEVRRIDPGAWARPGMREPQGPGPAYAPPTSPHDDQAETGFAPGRSTAPAATDETYSVPGRSFEPPDPAEPPGESTSTP